MVLLDLSKRMIDAAWDKALKEGMGWRVHCLVCDVTHLPLRGELFDLTTSIAVVHHLPKDLSHLAVREIVRVTSKGGNALLSVWSPEAMDKVEGKAASGDMSLIWWRTPQGFMARDYWRWKPREFGDLFKLCDIPYFDVFASGGNIFAFVLKI